MTITREWWRGGILYQIYPRSFYDTKGQGAGEIKGIIEKLDYIKSLGVDAIWISPVFKSPMKDFGYDVSDYKDIDPQFGTLSDFKSLLTKAHAVDLKVMIDQVWSHSSDQHAWFIESRSSRDNSKHDWYVWADPKEDGTPPNNWLSYFGGPAWEWDSKRRQYYLNHYQATQPALNLWNPDVQKELLDIGKFWLDMGVDGFRMDAVHAYFYDQELKNNRLRTETDAPVYDITTANPGALQYRTNSFFLPETLDWIEEIRALTDKYEDRALLCEIAGEEAEEKALFYSQTDKRFHFSYTFKLFTIPFTKTALREAITQKELYAKNGWNCWSSSNHDVERSISRWFPRKGDIVKFGHMALALIMSLRGSYCMYQGEELGLSEADVPHELMVDPYGIAFYPEFKGRDGCRTPMPWQNNSLNAGFSTAEKTWLPIPKEHIDLAVNLQEKDGDSFLNATRRFIKWRGEQPALIDGTFHFIETPDDILGFTRETKDQKLLCLFNLSHEERTYVNTHGKKIILDEYDSIFIDQTDIEEELV